MTDGKPHKHRGRRSLLTGFVALFPIALTFLVLQLLWKHILKPISAPLGKLILKGIVALTPIESIESLPRWAGGVGMIVALALAVLAVYALGIIITTVVGRKLLRLGDYVLNRVPLINSIYPYAKQLSDYLFGESKIRFSRAVAIEYPRRGIYSLGFVTSHGPEYITEHTGREMLAVFVPTSPTPITGWVVTVPADEVIDLKMNVDQAIRFAVSCGVLVPGKPPLPELRQPENPPETRDQSD